VLPFLDANSLLSCGVTCKKARKTCDANSLWQNLCRKRSYDNVSNWSTPRTYATLWKEEFCVRLGVEREICVFAVEYLSKFTARPRTRHNLISKTLSVWYRIASPRSVDMVAVEAGIALGTGKWAETGNILGIPITQEMGILLMFALYVQMCLFVTLSLSLSRCNCCSPFTSTHTHTHTSSSSQMVASSSFGI